MAKIHFITQGCSANVADSEVMMGVLEDRWDELVDNSNDADIVVFNTCTVKNPSVTSFQRNLKELKQKYPEKKIIIAGCISQAEPRNYLEYSRIGTYQIKNIAKMVDETLKGNQVAFLERNDKGRLNIPKIRKNNLIEITSILMGCKSNCTFCKTKHARGNAVSYPVKDIVRHVSKSVEEGAREIWLTSQDNAVYGMEFNSSLAKLLKEIVSIDRDFKVRVGMGNPKYMLPFLDKLISVMKNPKIFKFIHIPLQSGSDKVLEDMKRGYKAEDFVKIVSEFRKEIPEISIATDIICGFPTETEKDFEETLKIINKTRPDMINYSIFSPRPGTPAAKMKQVDGREAADRCRIIMNLFKKIAKENNQKLINKKYKILITEKGKNNTWIGKNDSYKQIIVNGNLKVGNEVSVKIKDASAVDLKGELI